MATSDRTDSPIEIQLTRGHVTVVDAIDADLAQYPWSSITSSKRRYAYHKGYLHRLILQRMIGRSLEDGEVTDHIDGNGLNNRRSNLRLATVHQNVVNARIRHDNKTGFKGVSWRGDTLQWHAQIKRNGKTVHLGNHDTPEAAHQAYLDAAAAFDGEFAVDPNRTKATRGDMTEKRALALMPRRLYNKKPK